MNVPAHIFTAHVRALSCGRRLANAACDGAKLSQRPRRTFPAASLKDGNATDDHRAPERPEVFQQRTVLMCHRRGRRSRTQVCLHRDEHAQQANRNQASRYFGEIPENRRGRGQIDEKADDVETGNT